MENNVESRKENGEKIASEEITITEKDAMLEKENCEDELEDFPLSDETMCGIWCIRGQFLQRFANKKAYVFLYGVLGCVFSASYAYSTATITTIEKRFKIPSRNTGIITVGNDISQLFTSLFLSYYAGRGHRPRWMAFGMYTVVLYCFLTALPHFLYGSGEDALMLTTEYGATHDHNSTGEDKHKKQTLCENRNSTQCELEDGNMMPQLFTSLFLSYYAGRGHRPRWMAFGMYTVVLYCFLTALPHFLYGSGEDALMLTTEYGATHDHNSTGEDKHKKQTLCESRNSTQCELEDGNVMPQLILFVAQLISGIGGSLYYTLGVSYMDDNIKKSKTPALISFSYFLRMLGPAIGYALASFCLKIYISPTLTPTITNSDPRWLGAWWMGKGILGVILFFFATLLGLFPKTLPRAAARKAAKLKREISENEEVAPEMPASFKDMMKTFKRLFCNMILMLNNLATVFYFLGYMPYWIFMPKYIETQYRQSASFSSLITGTVGLVFSAIGILISGLVITKFKPRARYLAAWNVIIGAVSVMGIVSYAYLGCAENNNQAPILASGELETHFQCNSDCSCDYVKYSPVCSQDGHTFISACHAGCKKEHILSNGSKIFSECSCINGNAQSAIMERLVSENTTYSTTDTPSMFEEGYAVPGNCPVDCTRKFYIFLAVVCLLKFSGATGRLSNFLVSVRCVEEKDKAVAMGFGLMIMSLCAFIPSPILFGVILDKACMVWGKTCSGTGNCWLYNGETLRYTMNFTAATFVLIGTLFDAGVWYYVKGIKIFDEEIELKKVDEDK